jgi:hypothetical protein
MWFPTLCRLRLVHPITKSRASEIAATLAISSAYQEAIGAASLPKSQAAARDDLLLVLSIPRAGRRLACRTLDFVPFWRALFSPPGRAPVATGRIDDDDVIGHAIPALVSRNPPHADTGPRLRVDGMHS